MSRFTGYFLGIMSITLQPVYQHMEEWPVYVYRYTAEGRYHSPEGVSNQEDFDKMMPGLISHINSGKELRITNTSDEMLLHAKNGRIEWNGMRAQDIDKKLYRAASHESITPRPPGRRR